MRLDAPRDVPGVRAGEPDLHSAVAAPAGTRGRRWVPGVGDAKTAAPCASPPGGRRCPRRRRRRAPGSWSRRRCARPAGGLACPPVAVVNHSVDGQQASPRSAAPGPRGRPASSRSAPKKRHRYSARGQVPVGEQAEHAPRRAAGRRARRTGGRSPPVSGEHLHAQGLAEGDEPVEQRRRLEPFGDGGERDSGCGDPRAGVVPVAHVRQREDRPPAGGVRLAQAGARRRTCIPADDPLPPTCSAAGRPPASSGRRSASPRGPARPGRHRAPTRARFARSRRDALPPRRAAPVGAVREQRRGDAFGQDPAPTPSRARTRGRSPGVGSAAARADFPASASTRAARRASASRRRRSRTRPSRRRRARRRHAGRGSRPRACW